MGFWSKLLGGSEPPAVSATGGAGFDGSSTGRRFRRWVTTGSDLNSILAVEGDEIRRRSHDLVRKNPWAANAIDSWVGNCVGTGIVPQPKHPDPAVRKRLSEWWLRWTDESDAANVTDFYGQQNIACRATMESGEVLARVRWRRPEDGLFLPLQLQLLEGEHLPLEVNELLPNGNQIRNGIEFNLIGKRDAYHLYRTHPGSAALGAKDTERIRVPAESILHMYKPLRPGQCRGQAWFAPVLALAYELEQYFDAELVRKKTAAMITHLITELNPDDPIELGTREADNDEDDTPIAAIQPGSTVKLLPGEDVKVSQAADVGQSYREFLQSCLEAFAAGIGLQYYQLSGDLSQVSFSSIRAGRDEFIRRCEQFQHQVLVFQFNRPVWRLFLEGCVLAGLIDARDLRRNRADYLAVDWRPPRFAYVNPVDDVKAEVELINARLKSRSQSIRDRGEEPDQVDQQIADDEARAQRLGLPAPVRSGQTIPPQTQRQDRTEEVVQ